MSKSDAKERLAKLRLLINDYRYHYHVLDESIMSEEAADSLKHELAQLEDEFPDLVTPDSPTQRVAGKALDKFEKITHRKRMISLTDVFNASEVEAWAARIEKLAPGDHKYFCDVKMDGFACSLIYEDGRLVQAVTRGDGTVGENVTANVRTIANVPLELRRSNSYGLFLQGRTEFRGEIVMLKKDFDELNSRQRAEGKPEFANPRNLAAGTIRQLDPRLVAQRPLSFRGYDLLRDEPGEVPTYDFAYAAMNALGVSANTQREVVVGVEGVMNFVEKWAEKRKDLPYNTDGAVIKVNDRARYEGLGVVGKTPRGAVAFKYAAEQTTTVIKDIVISIGRTGAATPVAVFDPVQVAGTTVQHASLHNADEIARLDARIGDTVIIFKAGDIIPQVESVLLELRPKTSAPFDFESELKRQYPELKFTRPEGEVVYRAEGLSGPLILKRALQHFASRGALDIDGMGEKNVATLVDAGLVGDLADMYRLTKDDVLKLERFADISAENLVQAIAAGTDPPLERFVYGLGIRHVGIQTAIDLVGHFGSLEKLAHATVDELKQVEGIGEVVAESVLAWFADEDNLGLLEKFNQLGVRPFFEKKTGKLDGKRFVVTGSLARMSRDEAAEKIRALGGTFQSSVGKDTTYLVAGGKVGASKLAKARSFGTEVIDEEKFLEML